MASRPVIDNGWLDAIRGPNVELVTAGNKTAGTAFDVKVTARNGTSTDGTYTGSHHLTFSGPG